MGLKRIVLFEQMVSPTILQILFWAGIGGCLYGTWALIQLGNWAWIFSITLGPLVVRVIFERAMLAFRTYDRLVDITRALEQKNQRPA